MLVIFLVLLGLAWLLLLRLFAKTVVWLAVAAIGILLGCLSFYLFLTSGALEALLDDIASNRTVHSYAVDQTLY